ncbi:MAG: cation:proton antiporter [Thermoguttaceae bacterium]|nr:cation:proton antiporter [Thermoguttaceae bacterium]
MSFLFLFNLIVILLAGLIAGIVSKRCGIPMVIGYLVVGALIGQGGLQGLLMHLADKYDLIPEEEMIGLAEDSSGAHLPGLLDEELEGSQENTPPEAQTVTEAMAQKVLDSDEFRTEMISKLADLGTLFLLFSIGIQFAPSQLFTMKKFLFIGGPLQMLCVIVPIVGFAWFGMGDWRIGVLIGCAVSLSSTVLVFKSLEEYGQANSPLGLRAVAILLFQDMAIAPILLLLPLIFNGPQDGGIISAVMIMLVKAVIFVSVAIGIRYLFTRRWMGALQEMHSVNLMVLFTVVLFFGICLLAFSLDLPVAVGAFAAGVALSETRLTHQISALIVPFRETFSAIFFVSLGALFDIRILFHHPFTTVGLFCGLLLIKMAAGAIAFRVLGLSSVTASALGLGIAQLGELSFIILQQGGFRENHPDLYQQMLFVALLTIILTPMFLKIAIHYIRRSGGQAENVPVETNDSEVSLPPAEKHRALVVGVGPIGVRTMTYLREAGMEVCLLDMNPINLQPYAQEGVWTLAGDATEKSILQKAMITQTHLAVVTIPSDVFTPEVVKSIRALNPECTIVARCRYSGTVAELKKNGADHVTCEESEAGGHMVSVLKLYA